MFQQRRDWSRIVSEAEKPDIPEYFTEEELAVYNHALELYKASLAKASWPISVDEGGYRSQSKRRRAHRNAA